MTHGYETISNNQDSIIEYEIYNDFENCLVGFIHLEEGNNWAKRVGNLNVSTPPMLFGLYREREYAIDEKHIWSFLHDRVVPLNRQKLPDLLNSVGLTEYNLHELIRINGGKVVTDPFSLKRVR